jgi:UDP-glucose 4-epimerase
MKQKIFITGGAGFIGANLVKYLLDRGGFDIAIYDNLSSCPKSNLDRAIADSEKKGRVKFIKGDILNFSKLEKSMKGHDAVVHLAAYSGVATSLKNPKKCFENNAVGTFNVLEASRLNKISRFIFASSNAALGAQKPPLNEKMLPQPISPYGTTKLFGEALASAYFYSYGIKTVSLRFSNVFGPYSKHKTSVVASFLRQIRNKNNLEIFGDGSQVRDFIQVKDICLAIYLSLKNNRLSTEVFQIGTGKKTRILDLANTLRSLFLKSNRKDINILFKKARKGEVKESFSSVEKARKRLNFYSKVKLNQGLEDICNIPKKES